MQIQSITPTNYSKTSFGATPKPQMVKKAFSMMKTPSSAVELETFVSKLKNAKYDLLIKLLPYTPKAAETNSNAKMLTKRLNDVNSMLEVLAPSPKNTLRQTV